MKNILRAVALMASIAAILFPADHALANPAALLSISASGSHSQTKAGNAVIGNLHITSAWMRQPPPNAKVGGGYLTVTNKGSETDILIGGSAGFAGRVEIHEMSVKDGVMKMAPLKAGLEIKPGETVELKPGGLHIMFMGLKEPPKEGEAVPVNLVFRKAGEVKVYMPVAPIGAKSHEHGLHGAKTQ